MPRREFIAVARLGLAGLFTTSEAVAGPFEEQDFEKLIPPDKKFKPEWLARLTARGTPETYTGADLRFIGMPVGGLCTGTLYLGGDGRLWLWNVFNKDVEGIDPKTVNYAGQRLKARDGACYVDPPQPMGPVEQGFALRVQSADLAKSVTLDHNGFRDVTFLSHATAPGNSIGAKDDQTGKLTSRVFTIERNFIRVWIGGGNYPGETGVNLRVDGKVIRSVTGRDDNRMHLESLDARPWLGRPAVVEIVDAREGSWGNVGIGRITFSDVPAMEGTLESLPDVGTMGLALLGPPAEHRMARAEANGLDGKPGDAAEVSLDARLVGAIGRKLTLRAGESATVHFMVTWHFPNLTLAGRLKGRYYATKFPAAKDVARYIARNFDRLSSVTKLWRDTWYDSTLPYWFLNRTFANTSVLATTTCYRLADGRFWAWEGVGCCPGTCTHVWHYAQAMARIFPELERDLRERVDFGLALDPKTGVIRFRGEFGDTFAVDGQCGTILRAYREHQMSPDDRFLARLWPTIKRALQCLLDRDTDGSGVLHGPMHNTLDADWYGVVPWLVGLYHAALRAGEAMAQEVGDAEFARTCRIRFETGIDNLDRLTWREEYGYYIHVGDSKHMSEVGSYQGCEIDQVLGQSWAWQVGLGRVMNALHVKRALRSIWRFAG